MGGKLLNRDDIVDWGLKITDGCMETYNTSTGLGAGGWAFQGADGGGAAVPSQYQSFFNTNGWYPTDVSWDTRPEIFEVTCRRLAETRT